MSIEFPQTPCYRDIPIPECPYSDRMPLVNNPNPSFRQYCGVLNLLDRDQWNNELNDRSFRIHYPPYNLINRPQDTSECITPDCDPLVLSADRKESYAYWNKFNSGYDCHKTQGYPMYPEQAMYWPFQQRIAQCPSESTAPAHINTGLSLPNKSEFKKATEQQPNQPWTCGIQRNIDAESKLKQLGYYNNLECFPNNIICNPEKECDNTRVSPSGYRILSQSPLWDSGKNDMIYSQPPPSIYQRWNNLTRVQSLCSRG